MFVNVNIYVCQSSPYFEALFDLLIAFNHTILGQVHSLVGGGAGRRDLTTRERTLSWMGNVYNEYMIMIKRYKAIQGYI